MGFGKSDVHVSKPLTNFALMFMQEQTNFIADRVLPPIQSNKEADKYFKFDRANWRVRPDDLRAPGTESNKTNQPKISTDSFLIEERSLHDIVSYREIEEADAPLAPRQDATAGIVEQLLIGKELKVASTVFTTTAVANSTSLPAASKWDYTSTTNPISDVKTGISAVQKEIGRRPNVGVMGQAVWDKLQDHAQIVERVKYTQLGFLSSDLVAKAMGLDSLLIGSSVYMSTKEGITSEATAYIWGKNFLVSYANPRPMLKGVSHGYQFVKNGQNVRVKEWDEQKLDGVYIEGSLYYDTKIVSSLAGYLIVDAVS